MNIFALIRPKTLLLSFSPIFVALCYAWFRDFYPEIPTILAVFAVPFFLQMAANAHNDAKDFERGADNKERLGPKRLAASGIWSTKKIYFFAGVLALLGILPGIYLIFQQGSLLIALAGIVILAGAGAYSGGKKPISYTPFGEFWVILFFGIVAVIGSYFIFSNGQFDISLISIAFSMGFLAANVLLVNNYRDADTDKAAGRQTLCVMIGRENALIVYKIFFMVAHFTTISALHDQFESLFFLIPLIGLPFFLKVTKSLEKNAINSTLNPFLGKTALLQTLHVLLIAISYWVEKNL